MSMRTGYVLHLGTGYDSLKADLTQIIVLGDVLEMVCQRGLQ